MCHHSQIGWALVASGVEGRFCSLGWPRERNRNIDGVVRLAVTPSYRAHCCEIEREREGGTERPCAPCVSCHHTRRHSNEVRADGFFVWSGERNNTKYLMIDLDGSDDYMVG